jgi:Ca-activated chloride channel homolog
MNETLDFARIHILFWIWAVPVLFLLFLYGIRKRRRLLRRFAAAPTLPVLVPDGDRRRIRAGLILAATALGILALAGPRYGFHWEEVHRRGVELVVALDCSRSMLASDISPARLDRAKRKIFDLLGRLRGDRVGLVAFAGTAFLQCPLTIDYAAFHLFLNAMHPDMMPVGGTDLAAAVHVALDAFGESSEADRAIVLITDGEQTGPGDPLAAADAAAEAGVRLFCIGVGGSTGVPVPDSEGGLRKDAAGNIAITRLDEETLRRMAAKTGGTYVRSVAGDMDLETIYERDIRGGMETAEFEGGRRRVRKDRYQWPLALAVLALLAEMLLSPGLGNSRTRRTIPCVLLLAVLAAPVCVRAESRFDRGVAAYEAGEFETALDHFLQAQVAEPGDPRLLYNIGNAFYRLGLFEDAARHFRMAAETEGVEPELQQRALYNLGNARFRAREYEQALESYDAAMAAAGKLGREDVQAMENRAFVEEAMNRLPPPSEESKPSGDCDSDGDDSDPDGSDSDGPDSGGSGERSRGQGNDSPSDPDRGDRSENGSENGPADGEGDRTDGSTEFPSSDFPEPGSESPSDEDGDESAAPPPPVPDGETPPEAGTGSAVAESDPNEGDGNGDAAATRADRILNRLEDRPGRALIPRYGERTVERDW